MPNATIYIRKEDFDKWMAIADKSEFVHNALQEPIPFPGNKGNTYPVGETKVPGGKVVVPEPFIPRPPDPETGYPCCQKEKRCKHWEFDGLMSAWVNIYTGKTKEVL